jgi:hypothetical protein
MTITVSSTSKIVTLIAGNSEIQCRIWEGRTERGIPVHCYIPRLVAREDSDCSQFEEELQETRKPSAEIEAIPLRMIL